MHEQNNHMMHALMHWEWSNYTLKTQNWLEYRVLEQKSKLWKTQFQKFQQIDQFIITQIREHYIMT